jgi:hypothetical protein
MTGLSLTPNLSSPFNNFRRAQSEHETTTIIYLSNADSDYKIDRQDAPECRQWTMIRNRFITRHFRVTVRPHRHLKFCPVDNY